MITDQELAELNQSGWIPGPGESEEAFLTRVANYRGNRSADWQETREATTALYGFYADWIPLEYSKKKLSCWEGAATWLGPKIAVQLHPQFKKGKAFCGLYKRSEILAHEAVHAARMAFDQDRFEEHFAYQTSKNRLRKWLGPFFCSPWEATVLLVTLIASIAGQLTASFIDLPALKILFFLPLLPICWSMARLIHSHAVLSRCRSRVMPLMKDAKTTDAFLFRLTDEEIRTFAGSSQEMIREYIQTERRKSLRVRLIATYVSG